MPRLVGSRLGLAMQRASEAEWVVGTGLPPPGIRNIVQQGLGTLGPEAKWSTIIKNLEGAAQVTPKGLYASCRSHAGISNAAFLGLRMG